MSDVRYRSMMSSTDAIIWNIERDPQLRSTVMIAWELDSTPTPERMRESVDRMIFAIPRLRQRVVEGRPRPRWADTDELDLAHHVATRALPDANRLSDVFAFVEDWVAEPFDRSRPLWRLALLTGLPDGRSAVVIKVHHAIADGMGMLLMLGAFTDLEPTPARARDQKADVVDMPTRREAFSRTRRLRYKFGQARDALRADPLAATVAAGRTVASASRLVVPHRTPLSPEMTGRSGQLRMASRQLPLADLKTVSKSSGVSINDVFVTVVSDAVRRYHAQRGAACERLRIHVPVNSRTQRTADLAGNDFVPARIALTVTDAQAPAPIAGVSEQLAGLRREPALHHINTVSAAIQRLGRPLSRFVIGGMMKGVDVLASNVPGPTFPLYLAGSKITEFVAFGPPAGAAINVTLMTYDGVASFGITVDAAAVADGALLLRCFDDAIDEIATPDRHLVAV